MKARTCLIAILACLVLSSCIDMTEELFLNKKGNGKYILTMDLSSIMDLADLSDMLGKENAAPNEEEDRSEEESSEESLDALGGLFGEEEGPTKMDTIFRFSDFKDSLKQEVNEEILEKGSIHIKMDEEEKEAFLSFIVDFDQLSDINEFFTAFAEASSKEEESMGGMGGIDDMFNMSGGFGDKDLFTLSKRALTRTSTPQQYKDLLEGEDMEFAKLMFAGAKYTTIYHLPGRVKSTSIPNARIDGKTITIESDFLDLMEEKVVLDGVIKFKRR